MLDYLLNNHMSIDSNQKKPTGKRGGARPGSGRPKGSTERVTVQSLLAALETVANGKTYPEQLAEDYMTARLDGDRATTVKYHNLIMNKVAASLTDIVVDETSTVENRQHAFLKALETIGTVSLQQADDSED